MNNEYNRYYIRIPTILGRATITIHQELTTPLPPDAPAYRTVAKWDERFREGREDVNEHLRADRPLTKSQRKILNW